jgi:hypothetical protein
LINAIFKKYEDFDKFVTDFLITVMDNGSAVIIVNYQDYQGMITSLNGKVLNGNALTLNVECAYTFDDDIKTAQKGDGNIMITVFSNANIIGEPVFYPDKAISFIDTIHFIETDAANSAMNYAITSTCVPFQIENKIRL